MHIIYRQVKADNHSPEIKGTIASNVKAIKYVAEKNKEEQAAGGWYHWYGVEVKRIKV